MKRSNKTKRLFINLVVEAKQRVKLTLQVERELSIMNYSKERAIQSPLLNSLYILYFIKGLSLDHPAGG
jgi:hypothetical protein